MTGFVRTQTPRGVAVAAAALLSTTVGVAADEAPRVRYSALSDAARAAGQLARYDGAPVRAGEAAVDGWSLRVETPRTARAYDVVPIRYALRRGAGGARVAAVETVAFEDAKRARNAALHDMAIPGDLGVRIEYLGSVSADFLDDRYVPLSPDGRSPPSPFPPYRRDPLTRSGTVREARAVWFQFRITNTGDTILDPEGFGACFAEPTITRLDAAGKPEWTATTLNGFVRFHRYLYPGDSATVWCNFFTPQLGGAWCRGLQSGDYRIDFRMVYRYHRQWNWGINIWTGAEFARLVVPVRVDRRPARTPVRASFQIVDAEEKMPGYLSEFEEFMTSFRVHTPSEASDTLRGTLHLQVAPWTRWITAKLVLSNPRRIAVVRLPIRVTQETLAVRRNSSNPMVIDRDGREEPVILAMFLPGMRSGFPLGPYPERHLDEAARELRRLGVNVISNSAGSWWIPEITGRKGVELHSACYKHFYDVLTRKHGLKVMGWSVYPPSSPAWYAHVGPLLGRSVTPSLAGYGYGGASTSVDMGDPALPEVIAAWATFNHTRWGDTWFRTRDGRVPIEMEDTWGWMRDDINLRYSIGPLGLQRFHQWLRGRYGNVAAMNAAWSTSYRSFEEVEPERDQGVEGDGLPHGPVYNRDENPFHDWSPATEDWDRFRTELRMDILRRTNALLQQRVPGAALSVRTEGSNLIVRGDPVSSHPHERHLFYSQRRNAMVFDVVRASGALAFASDYTTLPFSEARWRAAMREMVAAGVTPHFLPQFDHMRDILLNPHYGREYRRHYNLSTPTKGMMIHCLMAAYPWWKATYEEGGAPGIIWDDYGCDGFATETQKREVALLRRHLDRACR